MEPIILASSSPRRQEILQSLNIPFIVHPADCDETVKTASDPHEVPELLAAKKVKSVTQVLAEQEIPWVLGADTMIITSDGTLLGKPADQDEAAVMIKQLQGKTHEVVTGLALYNGRLHDMSCRTSCNRVTIAPMSDEEIDWYVQTGEWHGAAGAYRIQGLMSCFIKKIEGTESSVMGLPIFELYDMLKEQGYSLID
ncbi:MAG: septum formation protein Maf [Treponema sp.]|nr:septum formation protein Maf [Treponema sp.]